MSLIPRMLGSPKIVEILVWYFDFDLNKTEFDENCNPFSPELNIDAVAGDGTGGVFIAIGAEPIEERKIVYIGSEGQIGALAPNLSVWLGIILQLPYWWDLLKFSGGGNINEMRRALPFLEVEYREDYPGLELASTHLVSSLALNLPGDPISVLHHNVRSGPYGHLNLSGSGYDSLFNTFVVEDNPAWS